MAVQIKSIQIKKLGPLSDLQFDLGMLNLIYGRNESGKTYIAEFLLHSIFRHARNWDLRDINTAGSVNLQGLDDHISTFSPNSPKKIEDYWQENDRGLPVNMARLLVVKGGELALSDSSPGGVSREVLKNALTSQVLLDQIRGSIQPTVQKAEIIEQKISGRNQGQISDLNKLRNKLDDIDKLLKPIERNFSQGPVRQIEDQIDYIQRQLDQQLLAKRHHAFVLHKKQKKLLAERGNISNETLMSLRDKVRDHKKLKMELKKLAEEISSSQPETETYHWLESAVNIWEEKELENKDLPKKILMVSGAILLSAGLINTILQYIYSRPDLFWAGISIALIGGLLLVYFGLKLLRAAKYSSEASERDSIQSLFKEKFGHSLKGATGLRAERKKYHEIFLKTKTKQEDLIKLETQVAADQQRINESFFELLGETCEEKLWETSLDGIQAQAAKMDEEISNLALDLARLTLDEAEYLDVPQNLAYDPQEQTDLEQQLSNLNAQLRSHNSELDTLKARAAEWTRDEISSPWSDVLHNLRTLRNEINQSCIDLTAEIVAKIGLSEILSNIEKEEDQKILENINSEEVSSLLEKMTGKYTSLNLTNDQLYANDAYQGYPLRDLSTGAREQIQLALRLGIASRISGGEPLFIILDDAFQHSDWDRRESLVKETVGLVKNGWQVIYLTMDDHIRDLFLKVGQAGLKNKFKYLQL